MEGREDVPKLCDTSVHAGSQTRPNWTVIGNAPAASGQIDGRGMPGERLKCQVTGKVCLLNKGVGDEVRNTGSDPIRRASRMW
jgi:hypothetical protein